MAPRPSKDTPAQKALPFRMASDRPRRRKVTPATASAASSSRDTTIITSPHGVSAMAANTAKEGELTYGVTPGQGSRPFPKGVRSARVESKRRGLPLRPKVNKSTIPPTYGRDGTDLAAYVRDALVSSTAPEITPCIVDSATMARPTGSHGYEATLSPSHAADMSVALKNVRRVDVTDERTDQFDLYESRKQWAAAAELGPKTTVSQAQGDAVLRKKLAEQADNIRRLTDKPEHDGIYVLNETDHKVPWLMAKKLTYELMSYKAVAPHLTPEHVNKLAKASFSVEAADEEQEARYESVFERSKRLEQERDPRTVQRLLDCIEKLKRVISENDEDIWSYKNHCGKVQNIFIDYAEAQTRDHREKDALLQEKDAEIANLKAHLAAANRISGSTDVNPKCEDEMDVDESHQPPTVEMCERGSTCVRRGCKRFHPGKD